MQSRNTQMFEKQYCSHDFSQRQKGQPRHRGAMLVAPRSHESFTRKVQEGGRREESVADGVEVWQRQQPPPPTP